MRSRHVMLSLNQPIAYDAYKANPATGTFIIIDRCEQQHGRRGDDS